MLNKIKSQTIGELSLGEVAKFHVMEPAHPHSNPRHDIGGRNFLDLFYDFQRYSFNVFKKMQPINGVARLSVPIALTL